MQTEDSNILIPNKNEPRYNNNPPRKQYKATQKYIHYTLLCDLHAMQNGMMCNTNSTLIGHLTIDVE